MYGLFKKQNKTLHPVLPGVFQGWRRRVSANLSMLRGPGCVQGLGLRVTAMHLPVGTISMATCPGLGLSTGMDWRPGARFTLRGDGGEGPAPV